MGRQLEGLPAVVFPKKNYMIGAFHSHRLLNPMLHLKFRKNIHFLASI